MTQPFTQRMREWFPAVFTVWLSAFYIVWLILVGTGDLWQVAIDHWEAAAAMVVGSCVAGSTPLGGGAVGFPALVLLLHESASVGRGFSLAIQSIGMTSATIFLLARRAPVEWTLLKWTLVGSTLGTPMGAWLIAPHLHDVVVKLIFAVAWASFGIMHLMKMRELVTDHGANTRWRDWDGPIGLTIGVTGGIVASITGVAIDMMIYATLMLLYRADLKVSIPTSVLLMAFTSVVGIRAIWSRSNAALAQ